MGDGSGLSHVKQGFDAFDSGDHSGQNREHNFVSRAGYLTDPHAKQRVKGYGATLYYLNLDQSALSSFTIATSD